MYILVSHSRQGDISKKMHTLYIPIYLHEKVYTLYIRINSTNIGEALHPDCIHIFLPATSGGMPGILGNIHMISKIRIRGNFKKPGIQRQR